MVRWRQFACQVQDTLQARMDSDLNQAPSAKESGQSVDLPITNTKDLARVLEGAVRGLQNLYNTGFIHANIAFDTVLVDGNGKGLVIDYHRAVDRNRRESQETGIAPQVRPGVRPFFSRLHLRAMAKSTPLKALLIENSEAVRIWNVWNGEDATAAAQDKDSLREKTGFRELHQACASRWVPIEQLLGIFKQNCPLLPRFFDLEYDEVETGLLALWEEGSMSYERLTEG
ncbi:BQ2448_5543 [Microbotryum intermedium]|uniref:BQ2448_5543 protein n=1 Tax=Microbotryum intermedium TaxID=269621 RepID=A0A238F1I3_9BASI|nr:BQ2448_5543 [Microbotryum intermedium]